jgi:3-hydroxybutyrate dehydrogenase
LLHSTKQKTAIITGSTSGIGLTIARQFALKWYDIAFDGLEINGSAVAPTATQQHCVEMNR